MRVLAFTRAIARAVHANVPPRFAIAAAASSEPWPIPIPRSQRTRLRMPILTSAC